MSNNGKKDRHSIVDSGDSTDAVLTFHVKIMSCSESFIYLELTVDGGQPNVLDFKRTEAQTFIRALKSVKLEPKGHPFYDFLK